MTAFCNARVMHPVRSALPFGYFLSKNVLMIVAVFVVCANICFICRIKA